ncbi:NAD(P)H-dependent oxidoreductase [Maribacter sp. X9]|uniref:NAD(P)H-dependent oxidoreductase n=1 Tax=Maribacter sp. X9 TaxID=3402159 RepID=UPI003AF3A7DF
MKNVLDKLNWRYATKKFDPSKKVSKEDLGTLLEAARMTASSYGLQPYHFFVVEDDKVRATLRKASWDQPQITDSSYLLVLANKPTFDESLVDNFIDNIVDVRGIAKEDLAGYEQMMKGALMGLTDAQKASWTSSQAYIALGNLLTIAAEMGIDTCPMEGFDKAQYNEILGLTEKNLNAAVVLAIGYRSEEDETQHYPKVRYSKENLITHI